MIPSIVPSSTPSTTPTSDPSLLPSSNPTDDPSVQPSIPHIKERNGVCHHINQNRLPTAQTGSYAKTTLFRVSSSSGITADIVPSHLSNTAIASVFLRCSFFCSIVKTTPRPSLNAIAAISAIRLSSSHKLFLRLERPSKIYWQPSSEIIFTVVAAVFPLLEKAES